MANRKQNTNCYIGSDNLVHLILDNELLGLLSKALMLRLHYFEMYPTEAPLLYERFLIEETKEVFLKAHTVGKTKVKMLKSQFFYAMHPSNMVFLDEATSALVFGLIAPVHNNKNH